MIKLEGMNFICLSFLEYNKYANSSGSSPFDVAGQFISIILAFLFILLLAYYATRLIANNKYQKSRTSNIKLIDGMGIGYQSAVQIIKVGNKYILIGVTKESISFLSEIPEDSIDLNDKDRTVYNVPFEKYLKKFLEKDSNKS